MNPNRFIRIVRPGGPPAIALLLLIALAGCGGPAREAPARHLLLVTLDTTRADRLGCYGYQNAGTPWLDALAARGALFERAYAQVPITLPSHVSIMTGLFPMRSGVHMNGRERLKPGVRTLAGILSGEGFFTAAAVGGYPLTGAFAVRGGFDRFDDQMADPRNPEGLERDAGEVVRAALREISGRGGKRLFLWTHFFDPHDPYEPPSPFREQFADRPYQGEIARVDAALAELVRGVEATLDGESLLVCVVADHGEALGEHGEDTHGFFIYEATTRVPLILAGPRVPPGRRYGDNVQTVDLLPTLLDLLDLQPPPGLDGRVLPLSERTPEPRPVYLETELPNRNYGWSALHGTILDNMKYIEAPRPELYDLLTDPAEAQNLEGERAGRSAELSGLLRSLRAAAGVQDVAQADGTGAAPSQTGSESSPGTPASGEPGGTEPIDPRLMSLGYVGPGRTRAAEPGEPLVDPKDRIETYHRFQTAAFALSHGRPVVALKILDELLAEEDTAGIRFRRAVAYRMSGRLDDASLELDALTAKDSEFPGIHLERTRIALALPEPDAAMALTEIEKHLRGAPSDAGALMYRGAAREMLDDVAGAEEDYRHALRLNPAFGGASLRLASVLVRTGRIEEAKAALKDRLARDPTDSLARGLLDSL